MPNFRFSALKRLRLHPPAGSKPSALTLVVAPAGYGKSTLVSQWVNADVYEGMTVRWVRCRVETPVGGANATLTSGGQTQFWAAICDALDVDPGSNPHSSALRAIDTLEVPTMLILDDFENVTNPVLDMDLLSLLRADSNLFVTVIARQVSVLDGPLATTQTTAHLVTAEDLSFTEDETAELSLQQGMPVSAIPRALERMTHGWPLAVNAAIQASARGVDRIGLIGQFAELIRQQISLISDPLISRVLYLIIVCEGVSLQLLQDFTGASGQEVLGAVKELEVLGLIKYKIYPAGVRYSSRFPELVFLSKDAEQELGDQNVAEFRRKHLVDLAEDDADRAMAELLETGELAAAEQVLLAHFLNIMTPSTRFMEAVRRAPKKAISAHLVLNSVLHLIELADPRTPRPTLERLHAQVRQAAMRDQQNGDADAAIVSLAALVMAQRLRGAGMESLRLAGDLERKLAETPERDLDRIRPSLPVIYEIVGTAGLLNGNGQMGQQGFQNAYDTALAMGNESEQIRGLSGLALAAAMGGHVKRARRLNARAVDLMLSSGLAGPPLARSTRQTARALVAVDDRSHLELQAVLDEVGAHLPTLEQAGIFIYAETQMTRMTQGPLAALQVLEQRVQQVLQQRNIPAYLMTELLVLKGNLLTYAGGYDAARAILEKIPTQVRAAALLEARLALFESDLDEAQRLAELMVDQEGSERFLNQAHIIAAVAAWEKSEKEVASEHLVELGTSLLTSGGVNVLGSVPFEPLKDAILTLSGEVEEKAHIPHSVWESGALEDAVHSPDAGRAFGKLREELHALPPWLAPARFEQLSEAELRVLRELREDQSREEMAKRLFISTNTVKFHLRGIYRKLEASNRWEALRRAEELGILESLQD